ncbi:hypothetical protein [Bosea sp. PAMC 26642]|uniref:hypothetical protein n=1 Tax=Bosea sp. (strain PAMC 26642) TaxID=1792307 RepID=UPI0007703E79|nr:hypothetical protein [Bosea sp. PAMC 26642]AMJ61387.1 hypothetical protein AXW83_14765 [Bosea sp. PAMC 26642]
MSSIDLIIDARVSAEVASQIEQTVVVAKGERGEKGDRGVDGSRASFPPWTSAPGHFAEGYSAYASAKEGLSQRLSDLIKPSAAKLVHPDPMPGAHSNSFSAVVRMPDSGSYFLVPYSSATARIYRSRTGKFVTPGGAYAGAGAHNGGALMPSGRIMMAPHNSTSLIAYNPSWELVETLKTDLPGNSAYTGVVVTRNGLAVFVPHNASRVGVFLESETTWSFGSDEIGGGMSYAGGVALPDGKVLMVPHCASRAAVYDPDTNATTLGAQQFPASESFFGGALIDDTKVMLFPHKHGMPAIYDFVSDILTPFPAHVGDAGVANFAGGVALPDGRFFLVPFQSTVGKIIDLGSNNARSTPGTYGGGACHGGVLMDDGDVLMAPFNSENAFFAATGYGVPLDVEFVTSPHNNRS